MSKDSQHPLERRIRRMSAKQFRAARAHAGGRLEWTDPQGTMWKPMGRLGYLWWATDAMPVNPALGAEVIVDAIESKSYAHSSGATLDFVWIWLGQQQHPLVHEETRRALERIPKPCSMGAGRKGDGGWLDMAFGVVEREIEQTPGRSRARFLAEMINSWIKGAYLDLGRKSSRDWRHLSANPNLELPLVTLERLLDMRGALEAMQPSALLEASPMGSLEWQTLIKMHRLKGGAVVDEGVREFLWKEAARETHRLAQGQGGSDFPPNLAELLEICYNQGTPPNLDLQSFSAIAGQLRETAPNLAVAIATEALEIVALGRPTARRRMT